MGFEQIMEKLQGFAKGIFEPAAGSDDGGYGIGEEVGLLAEPPVEQVMDKDDLPIAGKAPGADEHESIGFI